MASLLNAVTVELDRLCSRLFKPHFFLFTDDIEVLFEIRVKENLLQTLPDFNNGKGTSFAMEHAGVLDLSLELEEDYSWAFILLGKLVEDIELRLHQ